MTTALEHQVDLFKTKRIEELKNENEALRTSLDIAVDAIGAWRKQLKVDQDALAFHQRAAKLMHKRKPFLVITIDDPYFMDAYKLIQTCEVLKGTWTDEDQALMEKLMDEHQRITGKFDGGWHGIPHE